MIYGSSVYQVSAIKSPIEYCNEICIWYFPQGYKIEPESLTLSLALF